MTAKAEARGRILVVDDSATSLMMLAGLLGGSGYDVRAVSNGREALAAATADSPDLVLLDVEMPEMDGFQVCVNLHAMESLKDLPVIFITAATDTADKVRGFEVGGEDYITKPFQADEVLARVDAHVSLRRARRELENMYADRARRAEESKRLTEERWERVFRDSPIALSVSESDTGKFVAVNAAFLELQGASSPEQLLGKTSLELGIWKDEAERRRTIIDPVGGPGGVVRRILTIHQLNGEPRTVEVSASPYEIDGVAHVLVASLDITDRLRAEEERRVVEEQLRQSQKMEAIGQLAGGIAHDFNNLLTVIIGLGKLLTSTMDKTQPEYADVAEMVKAGERAADLTRQMLAFSRRQVLAPREVNLNHVVTGFDRMIGRLIGEDVKLSNALADDVGIIRADPGQLEQVLANLVVNARDAMPTGGTVTIATRNLDMSDPFFAAHPSAARVPHIRLSVSDTGTGMTDEVKAHIFEPFFTTKPTGKGTGLGLSTVFGIVQQSGGIVDVESALGRGTTFHVYFPRLPSTSVSAEARVSMPPTHGGGETVLITEDSDALRETTAQILERFGYVTLSASNADEAMTMAAKHDGTIHLLLTDVVMPGMSGRALADGLTRLRPSLKVLFVSGYPDDVLGKHGILDAGISLLPKPFTPSGLANKVREVLGPVEQTA